MNVMDYYHQGVKFVQDGDYDAAIEVFNTALNEFPDSFSILDRRADAWHRKGEGDKALADYTRMIAVKPASPDGWFSRGNEYHEMGEYDRAIADFTEAIGRMPEHPCYWSNRGISYYKKGDLDKALEDLNQSIALDPERSWALSYRGLVWKNKGDLDKALSDFTQALRYEPEDHWILDQRGYCWFIKEEYDQAIADFSAAIAIKPDDPELWLSRGVCYWNKKEEMDFEAITDFTKAIELAPDRAYAYYCRGGVYQFQAQEQIHITRGIIMERVKDEAQRLVLLGQLEQIGYKEFAPLFNRMLGTLRSNRTGAEDLLLKCANLIVEHSCEDAIQDFTQVIALEPENGDAFYQRGQCYAMGGEPGKAAADYEQACALDPGHVKAAEKLEYLLNRKQEAGSKQQVIGSKQQVSLFGIFYLLPAVSYLILVTQNKRIAIHPLPKRPLPEYCGKP